MKSFFKIPLKIWVVSFVLMITPIFIEIIFKYKFTYILDDDTREMFWFLTIFPSVFFSYYKGMRGGLYTAFIAIFINIVFETIEFHFLNGLDVQDLRFILLELILHLFIVFSVGSLAVKLKNKEMELARVNTKLLELSFMDELTGLANRRGFLKLSEQVIDNNPQAVCLFIDLDEFKPINDKYGHDIGDELLKVIANRLKDCVREDDIVGRIGGDEFVCLLKSTNRNEAEQIASRIVDSLSKPVLISNYNLVVTPSIGISVSSKVNKNINKMLRNADAAMYKAKKEEKNKFYFYEERSSSLNKHENN